MAISSPAYGDRIQAGRSGTYWVYFMDENGKKASKAVPEDEWRSSNIGDETTYQTFRFSKTPL